MSNNKQLTFTHRGILFIIVGPSGVGKSTIIDRLREKTDSLSFVRTLTTRPRRSKEAVGVHYCFVSEAEFNERIANNDLLEWQVVNGYYYGSPRKEVEDSLSSGKDLITDLEIVGTHELLTSLPLDICTIFIVTKTREELRKRIEKRKNESSIQIDKRMERADYELSLAHLFDYVICNEELESAVQEIETIIKARKLQRNQSEYLSAQGREKVIKTAVFNVQRAKSHGKANVNVELPKTIIGRYETPDTTLERLIKQVIFQSSYSLDPAYFTATFRGKSLLSHGGQHPYQEQIDRYSVESTDRSHLDELVIALDTIASIKNAPLRATPAG